MEKFNIVGKEGVLGECSVEEGCLKLEIYLPVKDQGDTAHLMIGPRFTDVLVRLYTHNPDLFRKIVSNYCEDVGHTICVRTLTLLAIAAAEQPKDSPAS